MTAGAATLDELVFKYAIYLPVTAVRRQHVLRYLHELQDSERFTPEGLRRLQLQRLQALVSRAARDVPHYRETLAHTGAGLRELEDLQQLPTVSKQALRGRRDRFQSPLVPWEVLSRRLGGRPESR